MPLSAYDTQFNLKLKKEIGALAYSMDTRNWPDWISLSPAGIESVRLQTDDRQNEVAAPNESVRKLNLGQLSRFLLRCTHAKLEKTWENRTNNLEDGVSLLGRIISAIRLRFVIIINIGGGRRYMNKRVTWNEIYVGVVIEVVHCWGRDDYKVI